MIDAVYAVVGIPLAAAVLLALIPSYRVTAVGNVVAALATFVAGLSLLTQPRAMGDSTPAV